MLLFAASSAAQTSYQDPNGQFELKIPAGWTPDTSDPQQLGISKGTAMVTVAVHLNQDHSTPEASKILDAVQNKFSSGCPGSQVMKRGTESIAGFPGVYMVLSCPHSGAGTDLMKLSVATANGKTITFNTAAYSTEYAGLKSDFDAMAKSFYVVSSTSAKSSTSTAVPADKQGTTAQKLAALERGCNAGVFTAEECAEKKAALSGASAAPTKPAAAASAAPAATPTETRQDSYASNSPAPPASTNGPTVYRDPLGRFSATIPTGWQISPQGDGGESGVEFSKGSDWGLIGPVAGAQQPSDVVAALAKQLEAKYGSFRVGERGPFLVNGHPAYYAVASGINAKGVAVQMTLAGVESPDGHYLAMMSSKLPRDSAWVDPLMSQVAQSVRFPGE